jgi:uncharacterized surface protein with fasciclin (FAS1) repeats
MLKRMVALTVAVLVLALPIGSASAAAPSKNIVETAAGAPQFSTLVSLVKKAGLVGTLSGKAKYTVFAPTNAAFAKVPKETLDTLLADKALLKKVLLYHVLPGSVPASKVVKTESAKTAEGARVEFSLRGKNAFVNESKIITTDIRCSNGIVHAINAVLIPPGV